MNEESKLQSWSLLYDKGPPEQREAVIWYDRLILFWDFLEPFPFGIIFSLLWFETESLLSLRPGICLAHAGSAMQIK